MQKTKCHDWKGCETPSITMNPVAISSKLAIWLLHACDWTAVVFGWKLSSHLSTWHHVLGTQAQTSHLCVSRRQRVVSTCMLNMPCTTYVARAWSERALCRKAAIWRLGHPSRSYPLRWVAKVILLPVPASDFLRPVLYCDLRKVEAAQFSSSLLLFSGVKVRKRGVQDKQTDWAPL